MRTSILAAALGWSTTATAAVHVYTYDTNGQNDAKSRQLSPVEARVVLAQRIGAEDYHLDGTPSKSVVEAIQGHGLRQEMFGNKQMKRITILVEGEEISIPLGDYATDFTISPSPSTDSTRSLFLDLARQTLSRASTPINDAQVSVYLEPFNAFEGPDTMTIASTAAEAMEFWDFVLSQKDDETTNWSITVISATTSSGAASKDKNIWGTYSMPQHNLLHKRQQPQQEEPLEDFPAVQSTTTDKIAASVANSTTSLPGIFPTCFPSLSTCESLTQNCTGHGSCSKKYTDPTAKDSTPFKDCYTCSCSATVNTDSEGRKQTTYWGGPACQKQDVSVQFWLIALFTVGMVFLISFAVGSVWSMGDEELPSVIGAGVSGPTARK